MTDNIEILKYENFEVKILLTDGGNLISFTTNGIDILNSPTSLGEYQNAQNTFGNPNLFPPNRIKDGKFNFNNREYQFPKKRNGHSLHGFLNDVTWKVINKEELGESASLTVNYTSSTNCDYYEYYPHLFNIERTYTLSKDGLKEDYKLTNLGEETMPVSIGFHTAFKIYSKNFEIVGNLGRKIELDDENIPTGRLLESDLVGLKDGFDPLSININAQYEASVGGENTIIIKKNFECENREIHYTADKKYQFWVLCNYDKRGDVFCIEPHTSMIDGHNYSREKGKLIELESKKVWRSTNKIEIK